MKKKSDMGGSTSFQQASLSLALRAYRQRVGLSQREVADILNLNRSTYSYYELGKTLPDPVTLHRIAKIFGVPVQALFEEEPSALTLSDSGPVRQRARKKPSVDPQRVGELTSGERSVIAFLRDKGLSAECVLQALRKRFG